MHVAFLVDLADDGIPRGGVQSSTVALVHGLVEIGVRVTVITPDRGHREPVRGGSWPFSVIRLPMGGKRQLLRGFRPWLGAVQDQLHEVVPDIVHGQGLLHNGLAAAESSPAPSVVTAHGDPVQDARHHYPVPIRHLLQPLLRSTVKRAVEGADFIVNVNPDWRVNLPAEPRCWQFVPNAVDSLFFEQEPPPHAHRAMFFGDRRRIKGLAALLRIWPDVLKHRPEAELHLYCQPGEGPIPAAAIVHGPVPPSAVARAMASGGVVVVPSLFEVAPLVVGEAWAVGVPVVVFDVGGVRALAGSKVLLVRDADPEALTAGILSAWQRGPRIDRMVARASEAARQHRHLSVARTHLKLYEDLVARNR